MGMAASQARLLSLQARKSNLEYAGQQINQERSVLSQQCTALYNSLLAMQVPTPPSTSDFTTITYSGTDGTVDFTLGTIKPDGDNMYVVERQHTRTGEAFEELYSTYAVTRTGENLRGSVVTELSKTVSTGNYSSSDATGEPDDGEKYMQKVKSPSKENVGNYYILSSDGTFTKAETFVEGAEYYEMVTHDSNSPKFLEGTDKRINQNPITEEQALTISKDDIANYYIIDENGNATKASAANFIENEDGSFSFDTSGNTTYFKYDANGAESSYIDPNAGDYVVAGQKVYNYDTLKNDPNYKDKFNWGGYEAALRNTYGDQYTMDDFYVYVVTTETGVQDLRFTLKSDVNSPDGWAKAYKFNANGKYTESEELTQCKLLFDASGRAIKLSIPSYDSEGNIVAYQEFDLIAEKVTDDAAYQDAYNEYEYAQYEYDKKQQEINAKTEIIQQEDRNLELKLQRLDSERQQIEAEVEALDKVLKANIDDTYKTFSG